MAPWILIALVALLGFAWRGTVGGLAGLVLGYLVSLLLGGLILGARGGYVPRKVRRETAHTFLRNHGQQAERAFPGLHRDAMLRAVEDSIERVVRRSMDDNPGLAERALALPLMQSAADALANESETEGQRQFWLGLLRAIEETMYR